MVQVMRHHRPLVDAVAGLQAFRGMSYEEAKKHLLDILGSKENYGNVEEKKVLLSGIDHLFDDVYLRRVGMEIVPDLPENREVDPICRSCIHREGNCF